jgi:pilus assembly protein FimV
MTRNSRVLFGLLFAMPMAAHAVGLGDIHLGSSLNQPLNADIELLGATSEELTQLRAGVASRELFARYGIDRPSFLGSLSFKVSKDAAGRNVLSVHSSEAISEPFVTFLVELSWPRGHLIREYTVLLDPPVFESAQSAAPALAAPVTGTTSPAAGTIDRTPPAPRPAVVAPAPAPTPAPSPAPVAGGEYTVARNDALSTIVRRQGVSSPADVNRLMIATFRANPSAFDGNINRLRRGAVLRIPPESEWSTTDAHEAAVEVNRQVEAWHAAGGGGHGGSEARLRLVLPKEPTTASKDATPAPAPAPAARNAAQERAAADARRLLELKNAELARLQAQAKAAPKPAPVPVPAPAPKAVETPPPAPAATEAKPVEKPVEAKKPAPPVVAEPGLMDTLSDNAGLIGGALGGIVVLLAGLFGLKALRRRRAAASDLDSVLQPHSELGVETDPSIDTQSMRVNRQAVGARDAIVVEEGDTGEYQQGAYDPPESPTILRPRPQAQAEPPVDSRLTAESSIGLDQADPLAEADFHMAYGLYDQAADIVRLAIDREPGRRDLQMKLLEVYFVWGNKDAFIDVARTLARGRDEAPPAEWEKVAIMGRQIAPEDALFADRGHTTSGDEIDLDLDAGGAQGMDLELLGDATQAPIAHDGVDLDLGSALAGNDPASDTGEAQTVDPERFDLLLEPEPTVETGAITQEMPVRADAPTVEQPVLPRSAFEDGPTVEMPAYDGNSTLMEKLDLASRKIPQHEATAEISIDELGIDTGTLGATATANALSDFGHDLHDVENPTLDPIDAHTLLNGETESTRSLLDTGSGEHTRIAPAPTFNGGDATELAPRLADAQTELLPSIDAGSSAEIELSSADLDLDLDELARALENDTAALPRRDEMRFSSDVFATGIHKAPATGMDLDVGSALNDHRDPTVTERMPQDLDLPELEPVTLSEVGTKLDLARAYMDMGDPDGARSILQEVMSEGSASQKVEAQRLIETLPR